MNTKGKKRSINGHLLDITAGAEFMGGTPDALRAQVRRGTIPYRRMGGRIVFIRAELEKFISELPGVTVEEACASLAKRNGGRS